MVSRSGRRVADRDGRVARATHGIPFIRRAHWSHRAAEQRAFFKLQGLGGLVQGLGGGFPADGGGPDVMSKERAARSCPGGAAAVARNRTRAGPKEVELTKGFEPPTL